MFAGAQCSPVPRSRLESRTCPHAEAGLDDREVKVYAGPFSSATDPAEPFLGGGEGGAVFFT